MFIRMKQKYYDGLKKNGSPLDDDPVLEGCKEYESRKRLKDQYKEGLLTEKAYIDERRNILKTKETPPPIIKMELHHGHIVVMHGADLQKYYEVSFYFPTFELKSRISNVSLAQRST